MYSYINSKIKGYSDKKYSFITGNGTSAIYLALKASGIPKGSKVAVPNISCPDPVYALIWAGYKPVFIDVNIEDYNISVDSLKESLERDSDIRAIIAIHLFGNACDIVSISSLAKRYNCFLLEDCAQAFGNKIDKGRLGSFGDVSVFSFGNGKIIEVGHGGSVQSNDKELLDKIKDEYKKLDAYNKNRVDRLGKLHRTIYYKLYYLGIKYPKLNILNLVYVYFFKNYYLYQLGDNFLESIFKNLKSFKENKKERIENLNLYVDSLSSIKNIKLAKLNSKILSRFTIFIDNAEEISKNIRDNGIPSNTMYPMLVDRFKLFFNKNDFRNSYKLKGKLLNLWLKNIEKEQIYKSIKVVKQ